MAKEETENTEEKSLVPMGESGLAPRNIDEMWRYGCALSRSTIVPKDIYFNQPDNCFIALDLAQRSGCHWLTIMQHVYIIHGRPAMDATLSMALANKSGLFTDPIDYEVEGEDPHNNEYRVRAWAVRKSTGKKLVGPWIDWPTVKGEGWYDKAGSKWKTMPDQMFHYRSASWFQRRYCPEVTMGMMTVDEAKEATERIKIESTDVTPKGAAGVAEKIKAKKEKNEAAEQFEKEVIDKEPDKTDIEKQAEQTAKEKLGAETKEPEPPKKKRGRPKKDEADRQARKSPEEPAETPSEPMVEESNIRFRCKNRKCGIEFDEPAQKDKPGGGTLYCCPGCGSIGIAGVE
jgi:hypothetical protein